MLGGRRPLTLATAVRVEEALGVSLRRSAPDADAPLKDGVAPDGLGAYSRRGATWLEGVYVTVRPSFGEKGAIYAYRTEILWDEATSRLVFREAERLDAEFSQYGEVAVPNQSGHIYLVTNRHGQHRLITVSRPMISGEMYGVIATLLAGRGSMLTPIAAPIALLPVKNVPDAAYGRIAAATRAERSTASICSGSRASSSQCFCREPAGFVAVIVLARACHEPTFFPAYFLRVGPVRSPKTSSADKVAAAAKQEH